MGCVHPHALTELVRKSDGTPGLRCRGCGLVVYKGESWWKVFKRSIGLAR